MKKALSSIIGPIYWVLATITFFAISLDLVSHPGFVAKHFLVDSRLLVLLTFLLVPLMVFTKKKNSSRITSLLLKINNYLLLPIAFLLTSVLTVVEASTYSNFIFTFLHIHFDFFLYLFLLTVFNALALTDKKTLQKRWGVFLFAGSLLFLFSGIMVYFWPADVFKILSREDGIFENLQFVLYAVSSLLFGIAAYQTRRKDRLAFLLCAGAALMFFFVTGEEISWGQRIFNIQTPELALQYNAQKETTLHNIKGIQSYQYIYYMLFAFVLSTSWLLEKRLIKKFKQIKNLLPKKYLIFYFLPILIFYTYTNFLGGSHSEWQEFGELMLALGILFYAFDLKTLFSTKAR